MPLSTGQVVNNRYRIARLLGQGGMGAVYRAWDLSLNTPVALKEMIPEQGIDRHKLAELREQFRREAQVLAGLNHPNLPRVTDFFEWYGNAYLVMDFVEGESLAQLIARQGPLPEGQVKRWAEQLLNALEACHTRNILHRDIKPENIVICPDGRAVLVDFGLVKLWDPRHPKTQRVIRGMGTRAYASPEHFYIRGKHTEPRSDIYSLGATLYHALTGREPPSAMDRGGGYALTSPRDLGVTIRPQTEQVIMRAMAMDMDQRFANPQAMRSALQGQSSPRRPSQPAWVSPAAQSASAYGRADSRSASVHGQAAAPTNEPTLRDTGWWWEMATGMVMALAGVLVVQVVLFASAMTLDVYLGRGIWALLLGGLGWFLGDMVFQAVAQPEYASSSGTSRPTERLVDLTRRMTRSLSPAQQAILLFFIVVGAAVLVWILGPVVARISFVWYYMPTYALIGPFVYAATGRQRGRVLIAHTLVTTVGGALLSTRLALGRNVGSLFLAALIGGLLMEGIAFLAERTFLKQ